MDEEKTIEELKKELEKAKAENQRLELEVKYKDKATGLWNRKYAEKIIEEKEIGEDNPDFTVVFSDIDNLAYVNEKAGVDAGDALMKDVADALQDYFGPDAICCKQAGTKMCVFVTAEKSDIEASIKKFGEFIESVKKLYSEVFINYSLARKEDHKEMDAAALLKEAEYALQMGKLSKENERTTPVVPRRQIDAGDEITVLMIDDSLVNLRTIQTMLKDTYRVLMTTSGMEGYEIAKTKRPDVILLDYNMPVLDGERIMMLLKKSNVTTNIPVIFISGVSDKEKILKVANLKPAGYLLKPVEKDNLLNVINTVLQS